MVEASAHKIAGVRLYVRVAGLIGVALALILAYARNDRGFGPGDVVFAPILAGPFILALLSLALPRLEQQRWVWLVCAVLSVVAGLPLIFSGVGFFFLAVAICFGWAFVTTGQRRVSPSHQNADSTSPAMSDSDPLMRL